MDAKAEADRGPARCQCIVVTDDPPGTAPGAWLLEGEPGWQLPFVDISNASGYANIAEPLRLALAEKYALNAVALCHIRDDWPAGGGQENMVCVVEADPASLPTNWRRLDGASLWSATFADTEQLEWLQRWLRSCLPGAAPQRVAWARPGWRARAEAWIGQALTTLGLGLSGPITTRKLWSISCVLRAPTAAGDFYFKAVPPLFGREPAVTDLLARRHPGRVPEVVALDVGQGWMLMRGFSGSALHEDGDLAVWQRAARAYAEMQIRSMGDLEALRSLGTLDRSPLRLARLVDDLLADEALMRIDLPRGLTRSEQAELRALGPRLKAACGEWDAAGVPLTLEHGDFHAGNMVVRGDQFLIYDWTDACIGHPFVGLTALMENAKRAWRDAITQAYLEPWRAIISPGQIESALRLSRVLGPLHMALSYYDIQHAAEPLMQWQLDGGGPFFLKQLLQEQAWLA